jgi:acyl-Coa thioesterase superfamily protein/acyl-CoA thioesterase superfamily protein
VVGAEAHGPPGAALSEPVFRREGHAFVPTGHARGPWDPGQLHGGAPSALVAEAVQEEGYLVARLTIDFLAAVPMAPLTVTARTIKPGRNVQLAEAEMHADGRLVLRARATRLRRGHVELPADVSEAAPAERGGVGGPEAGRPDPFPVQDGHVEGFHRTAMDIRFLGDSGFGLGPALVWFRLQRPLVDDQWPSPLARAVAAADFGNGVSRVLDFDRYLFVNTDLTVHLHREPVGEWVLLDARTRLEAHGAGLAQSILSDERGQLGLAAQSLFVASR